MEGSRAMTVPAELTEEAVRQALRQVKDPELDMNIIDLGLVYDVAIAGGDVRVNMTLTSPGCPAGPIDRKSTRLNSSHRCISYAVFCLKKKNIYTSNITFGTTTCNMIIDVCTNSNYKQTT